MTKKDWFRFWLHFPVGVFCGVLSFFNAIAGLVLSFSFISYEVLNDWRKHDSSYKDVFGFAFGYGSAWAIIILLWLIRD